MSAVTHGRRTPDGYLVCQVRGCTEAARSWLVILDMTGLELEVHVCPRHERELEAAT